MKTKFRQENTLEERMLSVDQAYRQMLDFVQSQQRICLLALAGGSCSGKTFIAEWLVQALEAAGVSSVHLCMDRYFKNRDDDSMPMDEYGKLWWDHPRAYHQEEFRTHVKTLLQGRSVRVPKYVVAENMRVPDERTLITPAKAIIAEGLHSVDVLTGLSIRAMLVFIDCSYETRLARRIKRDTERYGVSGEAVEIFFRGLVEPGHQRFVQPQLRTCDILIDNS